MMSKKLVIFIDSGDTLVDESTEIRNADGIVEKADLIFGARETIKFLTGQGHIIVLVADGEAKSFENIFRLHGIYGCFSSIICSEKIGERKPSRKMFEAAMKSAGLSDGDKGRIIMVGNNLARDVKGANEMGIISVFMDWSPRYPKTPSDLSETPDYIIHEPKELIGLVSNLQKKINTEH
ncbi:MAG: HAD family hydrolase [Oscillospiraceae bacterium]|nr:HAD family hydrolase [Oscillospiraceae bacterium]